MKNFKTNFALIAFFAFATFAFTFAAPGGTDSGDSLTTAQASAITIAKAVTCADIADREPVGTATSFSKEVGKVYLYSRVNLPKGTEATIQHVWKLEGKAISTVDLDVRGPIWRTRSYKTITPKMTGKWTVDVMAGGTLLESVSFNIQ